jgi:hypothetical protein
VIRAERGRRENRTVDHVGIPQDVHQVPGGAGGQRLDVDVKPETYVLGRLHDLLDHGHRERTQGFGVVGPWAIGQPRPVAVDRDHRVVTIEKPIVAGHVDIELDQVRPSRATSRMLAGSYLLGRAGAAVCYPENVNTRSLPHWM